MKQETTLGRTVVVMLIGILMLIETPVCWGASASAPTAEESEFVLTTVGGGIGCPPITTGTPPTENIMPFVGFLTNIIMGKCSANSTPSGSMEFVVRRGEAAVVGVHFWPGEGTWWVAPKGGGPAQTLSGYGLSYPAARAVVWAPGGFSGSGQGVVLPFKWGDLEQKVGEEFDLIEEKPYLEDEGETTDIILWERKAEKTVQNNGLTWNAAPVNSYVTRLRPDKFAKDGIKNPPLGFQVEQATMWGDDKGAMQQPQSQAWPVFQELGGGSVINPGSDRFLAELLLDDPHDQKRQMYELYGGGAGFPFAVGQLHTIAGDICVLKGKDCLPKSTTDPDKMPVYVVPASTRPLALSVTFPQEYLSGQTEPQGFWTSLKSNVITEKTDWTVTALEGGPTTIQPDISDNLPSATLDISHPGRYTVGVAIQGEDGALVVDIIEVQVVPVFATKIEMYKNGTDLVDWPEVIFRDEPVTARVSLSVEIWSLEDFWNKVEMKVFSENDDSGWHVLTYNTHNLAEPVNTGGTSELWITLDRENLADLGVLPKESEDTLNEFTSADIVKDERSNHNDSNAFNDDMQGKQRGKARDHGNETELESLADAAFLKTAGVMFIQFRAPGEHDVIESPNRHIQNQADYLYYSGHGNHASGRIIHIGGDFYPADARDTWDKDLQTVIFSGCSVLDIKDYKNNYSSSGAHAASPGEKWIEVCHPENGTCQKGLETLLGYNYKAPLDIQGAEEIIRRWMGNSGKPVQAWMDANSEPIGIVQRGSNACAIDLRTTPWKYVFLWENAPDAVECEDEICMITYDIKEERWPPLIRYFDPPNWFEETMANDGSIDNTEPLTVTLSGDTWNGGYGENLWPDKVGIQPSLPEGLTAEITPFSDFQLEVKILGKARHHHYSDSIPNLRLVFQDDAFTSGKPPGSVIGYDRIEFAIIFH